MLQTAPVESFNLNPKSTQQAINLKSDAKNGKVSFADWNEFKFAPIRNQQFLVP